MGDNYLVEKNVLKTHLYLSLVGFSLGSTNEVVSLSEFVLLLCLPISGTPLGVSFLCPCFCSLLCVEKCLCCVDLVQFPNRVKLLLRLKTCLYLMLCGMELTRM